MKATHLPLAAALSLTFAMAACVQAPAPAPVARPAKPRPAPTLPVQAPASDNWMDIAQTPGDWRHGAQSARSEASFWSEAGAPMLRLRCLTDSRSIVLSLPESGAPSPLVTIRTETATRTLQAQPAGRETLVSLNPDDPLLDAIALSKGRFAVEAEGLPALYLPTWAEVSRVIEDCR